MTGHGSSRGRGRLWVLVLAALGAALVSLLVSPQWYNAARADESGDRNQAALEPGSDSSFGGQAAEGDIQPQIVGGTGVPNGKYPFMAFLRIEKTNNTFGYCGGSLIDSDSVLTAAHCILDDNGNFDTRAVTMAIGRTVISDPNQGQIRFATLADWHPNYNPASSDAYDAAVLSLDRPVNISPIKLATSKQNGLEERGRKLRVAGWGTTKIGRASCRERV